MQHIIPRQYYEMENEIIAVPRDKHQIMWKLRRAVRATNPKRGTQTRGSHSENDVLLFYDRHAKDTVDGFIMFASQRV